MCFASNFHSQPVLYRRNPRLWLNKGMRPYPNFSAGSTKRHLWDYKPSLRILPMKLYPPLRQISIGLAVVLLFGGLTLGTACITSNQDFSVGDTVRLKAFSSLGIPLHPGAGPPVRTRHSAWSDRPEARQHRGSGTKGEGPGVVRLWTRIEESVRLAAAHRRRGLPS